MRSAETYLAIDFTVAAASVTARLDTDKNGGQTTFAYKTKAYFQVFSNPGDMPLTLTPSDGSISYEGAGTESILAEPVSFDATNKANTTLPIAEIISYEWLGNNLGAVTSLGGNRIKSAISGVGYLKISYKANFRRYALYLITRDADQWPVIISIESTITYGTVKPKTSLTITFTTGSNLSCPVQLTVIDVCTKIAVPGASVALDGAGRGVTDSGGKIYLGKLAVNSTHSLLITKSGLRDLSGSFNVPAPSDEADCS